MPYVNGQWVNPTPNNPTAWNNLMPGTSIQGSSTNIPVNPAGGTGVYGKTGTGTAGGTTLQQQLMSILGSYGQPVSGAPGAQPRAPSTSTGTQMPISTAASAAPQSPLAFLQNYAAPGESAIPSGLNITPGVAAEIQNALRQYNSPGATAGVRGLPTIAPSGQAMSRGQADTLAGLTSTLKSDVGSQAIQKLLSGGTITPDQTGALSSNQLKAYAQVGYGAQMGLTPQQIAQMTAGGPVKTTTGGDAINIGDLVSRAQSGDAYAALEINRLLSPSQPRAAGVLSGTGAPGGVVDWSHSPHTPAMAPPFLQNYGPG